MSFESWKPYLEGERIEKPVTVTRLKLLLSAILYMASIVLLFIVMLALIATAFVSTTVLYLVVIVSLFSYFGQGIIPGPLCNNNLTMDIQSRSEVFVQFCHYTATLSSFPHLEFLYNAYFSADRIIGSTYAAGVFLVMAFFAYSGFELIFNKAKLNDREMAAFLENERRYHRALDERNASEG